jgi:hypothetical protein
MNAVLWVVRILVILLIIRMVVHWIAGQRRVARKRPPTMPERAGGTLVRDPHCGTYVPESRAIRAGSEHFCSTKCRDAWLAAHGRATGTRG